MPELPDQAAFQAFGFKARPIYVFRPAALSGRQLLFAAGGNIVVDSDPTTRPFTCLLLRLDAVGVLNYGKTDWHTQPFLHNGIQLHHLQLKGALAEFEWGDGPVRLLPPYAIQGLVVFDLQRFAKVMYLQSTAAKPGEKFELKQW